MPFVQRAVEPKFLSRTSLRDNDGKPRVSDEELQAVTNCTLSNALRQLASLVLLAEDIFSELTAQLQDITERSKVAQTKIIKINEIVEQYDPKKVPVRVGLITRKAANAVTPTVELRKDGDTYTLVTSSTFKTTEVKFKPGEEFDEERADGAKVKSVCTFEGNTLKQVQKSADGVEVSYIREFGPEEMKAVMTAKDVTCTRLYKVQ